MMQHRLILKVASLLFAYSLSAQQPDSGGYELKVATDHPNAIYQVKETVTFKIALTRKGVPVTKGKLSYLLSNDEAADLKSGEIHLSDSPSVITGSLGFPGFLRCKATFKDNAAKVSVTAQ